METLLPDFVIAQLYKNNLVIDKSANKKLSDSKSLVKDKEINISKNIISKEGKNLWLGNNAKNVVIIVSDSDNKYMEDDSLKFLTSILTACKLSLDDVAILNVAKTPTSYTEIKDTLHSKYLFLFGTAPNALGLSIPDSHYNISNHEDCKILVAAPLINMMPQNEIAKAEKIKLWNSLKSIFGI